MRVVAFRIAEWVGVMVGILSPSPDLVPQCSISVVALQRVRAGDSELIQPGERLALVRQELGKFRLPGFSGGSIIAKNRLGFV